jgi:hypothetical protein
VALDPLVRRLDTLGGKNKFEVENKFQLWKLKMKDLLLKQGFQKDLEGKSKRLACISYKEWDDLDTRALSSIILCLEDEVIFNIVDDKTIVGLWSKMESIYMKKSLKNKIFLKRQLYSLRMKKGTKIVHHLNVFNTLLCQLSSMEVKYEDADKEVTLCFSFSESWDHLFTSMWFILVDDIDYDIGLGDFLSKEMRRISSKETSTTKEMVVRGRCTKRRKN